MFYVVKMNLRFPQNAFPISCFAAFLNMHHKHVMRATQASNDSSTSKWCAHHKQVMRTEEGSKEWFQTCEIPLLCLPFSNNWFPSHQRLSLGKIGAKSAQKCAKNIRQITRLAFFLPFLLPFPTYGTSHRRLSKQESQLIVVGWLFGSINLLF